MTTLHAAAALHAGRRLAAHATARNRSARTAAIDRLLPCRRLAPDALRPAGRPVVAVLAYPGISGAVGTGSMLAASKT